MKICIITPDYPDDRISKYPFVEQLAREMVKQGHKVCVVAPYYVNQRHRVYKFKETINLAGNELIVLRPSFVTISNKGFLADISAWSKNNAVNMALHHLPFKPDVIYGHFWESGWAGFKYAKKNNIPLFVACGESNLAEMFPKKEYHNAMRDYLSGVICVSTKAKAATVEEGFAAEQNCEVFPNAIDSSLFYFRDKKSCRRKLGFDENAFIVGFVGWFNERKGVLRVSEAIKRIKDKPVYAIFLGSGPQDPCCDNILFKGQVLHDDVPEYLSCADVFVLPTRNEGCSNAVVEAMACGLPVISSDLPFNWDVLDSTNSIMIDPDDVDAIKDAVVELRDNKELRERLADGALKRAKSLTIDNRVKNIVAYMQQRMNVL